MRTDKYSFVNPENGDATWNGPLSVTKGDHSHMPPRTAAYLAGDERGHVNASSLMGSNTTANVVPQSADVNHGAYYSMEQGERTALRNGASVDSIKSAIVNGLPGDRPQVFMVRDQVEHPDGHVETIHHSFANESYANQQAWNDIAASLPGTFEAPNPGDGLRESMSTAQYAELMESMDAALPNVDGEYATADFSGLPSSAAEVQEAAVEASDTVSDADVGAGADCNADSSMDD